jgi:hypothetical protein
MESPRTTSDSGAAVARSDELDPPPHPVTTKAATSTASIQPALR